jgi:hypothetical protein
MVSSAAQKPSSGLHLVARAKGGGGGKKKKSHARRRI